MSKAFVLKGIVGGDEVTVECKSLGARSAVLGGAEVGAAGGDEVEALKFGECALGGSEEIGAHCQLQSTEIVTVALSGVLEEAGGVVRDKLTSKSGGALAVVPITNKTRCPAVVEGDHTLTGSITAVLPRAGTEKTTHALEFTSTSGSSLEFAENTAEFTGAAEVELATKEAFGTD